MTEGKTMTVFEIMKRDYRVACIHEAAHAAVARHYGSYAWWSVQPTNCGNLETMHFSGKCTFIPPPPKQMLIVCLSGLVAEEYYDDPDITADDIFYALDLQVIELSETDAAGADGYVFDDIEQALMLVAATWSEILADAERIPFP